MKSLAYIGTFALGAIAGGWAMISLLGLGTEHRVNNPVDDEATVYEDENTKIVRVTTKREGDRVNLAVIIHKDNV